MLKVPLVVGPSEDASKRTTSDSSIVPATPGKTAPSVSSEKRSEPASSRVNASRRRLDKPTSEPSKKRLKVPAPSKNTTSSFATDTPPTVPLDSSEKYSGLAGAEVLAVARFEYKPLFGIGVAVSSARTR